MDVEAKSATIGNVSDVALARCAIVVRYIDLR